MATPTVVPRAARGGPRRLFGLFRRHRRPAWLTSSLLPDVASAVWARRLLVLLVALPIGFNLIALLPELRIPVPSVNDDAFHYLFVREASQALYSGRPVFDIWSPALEAGFPPFEFYQYAPHLAVVALNRLLLGQVGLLTLFNLTRYLLLAFFPLTVYCSMRRLGFTTVAAAIAAAAASLLSADLMFGFEYDSYTWRGWGMYTQLWAMHLTFICLACVNLLLERGKGYVAAVLSCALLVLSHLLYAEMMVADVFILALIGLNRQNLRPRLFRMAVVGVLVATISAYFWVTFLHAQPYSNVSVYLESWKVNSFGAGPVLKLLVTGQLLDYGRLPVLTLLLGLGIVAALLQRTRPAWIALALFVFWLLLYFGNPPWGPLLALLPASNHLLLHRMIGGVDFGAILLIGLGGELIWRLLSAGPRLPVPPAFAAVALIGLLLLPAFVERAGYYAINTQWMTQTQDALVSDADARAILAALQQRNDGRVYAGETQDWANRIMIGYARFSDVLTYYGIPVVGPPYNAMSLNSDVMWNFDANNPADYDLYNARYVVAPTGVSMPGFLSSILTTSRYTLYQARTSGYAEYIQIAGTISPSTQADLFQNNLTWLHSPGPALESHLRINYPPSATTAGDSSAPACPDGSVADQKVQPQELDELADCSIASTLLLKVTYHPNWRITVDGQPALSFMVSPSFIGVPLPPGRHLVVARYAPAAFQYVFLGVGLLALIVTCISGRWLAAFDAQFAVPKMKAPARASRRRSAAKRPR